MVNNNVLISIIFLLITPGLLNAAQPGDVYILPGYIFTDFEWNPSSIGAIDDIYIVENASQVYTHYLSYKGKDYTPYINGHFILYLCTQFVGSNVYLWEIYKHGDTLLSYPPITKKLRDKVKSYPEWNDSIVCGREEENISIKRNIGSYLCESQ